MNQFKSLAFSIVGVGLGFLLSYFFFCKKEKHEINGTDVSWIFDTTKAKAIIGENYLFTARINQAPISILGEAPSADGYNAVNYFMRYTDTCTGFRTPRSYAIGYSINELMKYFSNLQSITDIDTMRVYLGMYPHGYGTHPDRLTAYLVAVGLDSKEKYNDAVPGYKIINLGTLCPTACPPSSAVDPRSLYELAGRPQ